MGEPGPPPVRAIGAATVPPVTSRSLARPGLAVLLGIVLAGCAVPGQLGSPPPPVPTEPAPLIPATEATPSPSPPPRPVLIASGRVEERVQVRTPGPATFVVRTEVLAPGASTGWHRHPGTETSVVTSGSVVMLRDGDCDGRRQTVGEAMFVPDAQPHLVRNDGSSPAELVVTALLAPDLPARETVPSPC